MWEQSAWSAGRRSILQALETNEGFLQIRTTFLAHRWTHRLETERWHHPRTFISRLFLTDTAKVRIECHSDAFLLGRNELFLLPAGLSFSAEYRPGQLLCQMLDITDAGGSPLIDPASGPLRLSNARLAASLLPTDAPLAPGEQNLRIQTALLHLLSPRLPELAIRERRWEKFQPLREALASLAPADWRIEDLAARMNCSPGALSKRFRRIHGITLKAFLLNQTISRAQQMLALSDLPASRVGAALGFADPAYFHRLFQRVTGHSPTQWRTYLAK